MNRPGLEPGTYGLTCRTGFHQPLFVAVWTLPSPQKGATRQVSEEPSSFCRSQLMQYRDNEIGHPKRFPADCPIRRIVTLSRTDGSQGVPAYGAVLPPAFRPGHSYLKSVALPTELPVHSHFASAESQRSGNDTQKPPFFQKQMPGFRDFPVNSEIKQVLSCRSRWKCG